MVPTLAENVMATQARNQLRGDAALRAADGLQSGDFRDVLGREVGDAQQRDAELRKRVGQTVGLTFYGTVLKMARNSVFKGPYGHGGRGEEVFRGQLHQRLAQRVGQAHWTSLHEALYRKLSGGKASQASGQETNEGAGRPPTGGIPFGMSDPIGTGGGGSIESTASRSDTA